MISCRFRNLRHLQSAHSLLTCMWMRALPVIIFVLACSLAGCGGSSVWHYLPATKKEEKTIYVVNRGWHTGIAISRQDLGSDFNFLDTYLTKSPYYEFGWGEAVFYQSERNTVGMALKALFWRNTSVLHVAAIPAMPDKYLRSNNEEKAVELIVSETGLNKMKKALYDSFKFDENHHPYPLKKGLYGESRFFKAEGIFYALRTCNTWTASLLIKAGVPMDTWLNLRSESVIRQVEEAKKSFACCTGDVEPEPGR